MRKLIAFDDDTFAKLTQLGRDRMGTLQELADEAFADLLKKHGIPIDLRDALRKSAAASKPAKSEGPKSKSPKLESSKLESPKLESPKSKSRKSETANKPSKSSRTSRAKS